MVPKNLEDRNDVLYEKLVPGAGHADTLEGEMLRAINKIIYRYYNDGDYYHKDYGTETAGPAHAFLLNLDYSDGYDSNNKDLLELERALFKILDPDNTYYGKDYEDSLNDALIKILDYIESREKSGYKINKYDMLHSEPLYENYEADEDDQEYDWDYDHQYGDYDDFAKGGELKSNKGLYIPRRYVETLRNLKPRIGRGDKITIEGRRFKDAQGNTYHTVEVFVNDKFVGATDNERYGYKDQYLQTAKNILLREYDLPYSFDTNSPIWALNDDNIKVEYSVVDVKRKRDL